MPYKYIFTFLLISNSLFFSVSGQERSLDTTAIKLQIEQLGNQLGLEQNTKKEFHSISWRYAQKLFALKNSKHSKLKKYKQFKAIAKERNAAIKKILTTSQYNSYLEFQQQNQKRMKNRNNSPQ